MNYRAIPTSLGYSPVELLLNRKIRTRLPMLSHQTRVFKNSVYARHRRRRQQMEHQFNCARGAKDLPPLLLGANVFVEDMQLEGTIAKKREEPRSYDVRLAKGGIARRNRKTLRQLPTNQFSFYAGTDEEPTAIPPGITCKARLEKPQTAPSSRRNPSSPRAKRRHQQTPETALKVRPTPLASVAP